MLDTTILITGVITLLSGIGIYRLWPLVKGVVPLTMLQILKHVARFFVYAAEAELGRGSGADKFDMALQKAQSFLEKYRLTFDRETVKNAILQEWLGLNMMQLNSGMKK